MKKKGFTLIELLAVIVILAVIALIATPMIMDVIEKARRGAAEASANHYIDAVELYFLSNIENEVELKSDIKYYITRSTNINSQVIPPMNDLVSVKGSKPTGVNDYILFDKNYIVKKAILTLNEYEIKIEDGKITQNEKIENALHRITFNDQAKEVKGTSVIFEDVDITEYTNLICNNGASIEYQDGQIMISDIRSDVTCKGNSKLIDTIEQLDDSLNTILMVNDDTNSDIYMIQNADVVLNLNGKKIDNNGRWCVFDVSDNSNFTINDPKNEGYVMGSGYITYNRPGTHTIINGGNYVIKTGSASFGNYNIDDETVTEVGTLTLNNVNVRSSYNETEYTGGGIAISNGLNVDINNSHINVYNSAIGTTTGTVTINNSNITNSNNGPTIKCENENCNIKINNSYIANLGTGTGINVNQGTVEINGEEAILDQDENYVSGTYIYSANSSSIYVNKGIVTINGGTINSPFVIWNGEGKVYINNGNITGGINLGTSSNDGYYYINNGKFQPGNNGFISAIPNARGKIYICNGLFSEYGKETIKNESPNVFIYYKDSVIWKNLGSPSIAGAYSSQILKDNTIVCQ